MEKWREKRSLEKYEIGCNISACVADLGLATLISLFRDRELEIWPWVKLELHSESTSYSNCV